MDEFGYFCFFIIYYHFSWPKDSSMYVCPQLLQACGFSLSLFLSVSKHLFADESHKGQLISECLFWFLSKKATQNGPKSNLKWGMTAANSRLILNFVFLGKDWHQHLENKLTIECYSWTLVKGSALGIPCKILLNFCTRIKKC